MQRDPSADDRRRLLATDVSRLAGLLAAAIGEASQLQVAIPDGIPNCTGELAMWAIQLRGGEPQ
jgi:hypothetical protein